MLCFSLYLGAISKYKPPGAYIRWGDLTEGFLRYEFGGAYIFEGLILGILWYLKPLMPTQSNFIKMSER